MLFVRDAVAIRWLIVAFGLLVVLAFVNSVLGQLSFARASKQADGFANDLDSMERIANYREVLRSQLVLRLIGAFGLLILMQFARGGREDTMPVVLLCIAALLTSTLLGLLAIRSHEARVRGDLPEGTKPGPGYRSPGPVGLALLAVVTIGASLLFAFGAASLPVLPNQYDAIGGYELAGPPPSDRADGEDACGGRPAARAACIIERNLERANKPVELPTFTPPSINIPPLTPQP